MNIEARITGVSPLLMNRFHEAAQAAVASGTSSVVRGDRGTPREQATPKLYTDASGRPVIPGPNLLAAIIDAGKWIKSGKSKLTTARSSLIPAGVAVAEVDLPVAPARWEVDSRPVVVPSTGGRILSHRPRFDVWAIAFTLVLDEALFGERVARELVDIAGQRVGLGDFRPARKGPFGRFRVDAWKVKR
jgi:hypothetical protein